MGWLDIWAAAAAALSQAGTAVPPPAQAASPVQTAPTSSTVVAQTVAANACCQDGDGWFSSGGRRPLESDHCFDNFIGPISTPVYSKDPRSLTEIRGLYVHNTFPGEEILGGGDFHAVAAQVRVALTERLTFIADKDGYLFLRPRNVVRPNDGWMNIAAGLKYTFLRDVETQTIAAAGVMYEIPTGEANVLQGRGDGIITPFLTFGKEFGDNWHVLANIAHSTALDQSANSSFLFTQLHIDKGINGWLYPLVELNWFHYTQSGDSFPAALGEGDGFLSFGTRDVAGNDRVTIAPGLKAKLGCHLEVGAVYEMPISNRKDIMDNRVVAELILRY